ncbi:uncharacterized protein LOC143560760 [Bidens hawaiensis]|uniref:uncharacterized protein LOC143560760 n=1 Tax=Bidens hawaiensis TaxID=980011 RepID=UPI00404A3EA3
MICTDHPFKNTTPSGGICAFCLQEKLGKLVSSSFPITVFPSSSSSSPSFRSDIYNITSSTTTNITSNNNNTINTITMGSVSGSNNIQYSNPNRSRILHLLGKKKSKNKKKDIHAHLQNNIINNNNIVLKRSKSSYDHNHPPNNNKRGGGLWSFLYLNPNSSSTGKKTLKPSASMRTESTMSSNDINIVVEENDDDVAFDRKVSRSRSVGCGSRSFSGDFFERISTGFGDCALLRVESQREGKPGIHERVRRGGLFSGFMITSSSTSSFSSNNNNNNNNNNEDSVIGGRVTSADDGTRQHLHARSKSWGWALASPMRAFKKNPNPKPNSKQKPNLTAVPSLLSVGR